MSDPGTADLKKLALEQRAAGRLDAAAVTIQQAIDAQARELGDLYGILGGTRKSQGDLIGATAAYDEGFRLEARSSPPSSYNELNRLVTRVLLCPAALGDPDLLREQKDVAYVDVPAVLAALEDKMWGRLQGERSNDYWAAGDLVVVAALNGDLDSALKALDHLAGCSPAPDPGVYQSYLGTFQALSAIDTPHKDTLQRLQTALAEKAAAG